MRIASLLIAACFTWSAHVTAGSCGDVDPLDDARSMYRERHDFYAAGDEYATFLSPELSRRLKRDWTCQEPGEQCALGADPWVDAQDGGALEPIEYVLVSGTGTSAVVEMRYRFGWEEMAAEAVPQITTMKFLRSNEGGCWLLDDLQVRASSLQAQLKAYAY